MFYRKYYQLGSLLTILLCILFLTTSCKSKPYISWNSKKIDKPLPPSINVYMENSGSMDGYMCPGSELKDAVYSYVSAMKTYVDTTSLYYINTQIIPYKSSLHTFVQTLTPAILHKTGGNTAHSEIADMLDMILKGTTNNTISVFVSDCIIDVPLGAAANFLNLRQTDITNAISDHLNKDKDLGVEVFCMDSRFDGMLYGGNGAKYYNGTRPYYIIIMGNKYQLAKINKNVPHSKIQNGVKNYCAFTSDIELPFQIANEFGKSPSNCKLTIKSMKNGVFSVYSNVDLSYTLQDETYLSSTDHYVVNGSGLSVVTLKSGNNDYGHTLQMSLDQSFSSGGFSVNLLQNNRPNWLDNANQKTLGIKHIVEGIANAFGDKYTGHITFNITKK